MALQKYVPNHKMVRNPNTLYKIGICNTPDAEIRFDPEYHKMRKFKGEPLGEDYNIDCKWSAYLPYEEAVLMEKSWEKMRPKNIWTDKQYNGITECRYLTANEYNEQRKKLYAQSAKKKYSFKPGYWKVYFMEFTKK